MSQKVVKVSHASVDFHEITDPEAIAQKERIVNAAAQIGGSTGRQTALHHAACLACHAGHHKTSLN